MCQLPIGWSRDGKFFILHRPFGQSSHCARQPRYSSLHRFLKEATIKSFYFNLIIDNEIGCEIIFFS